MCRPICGLSVWTRAGSWRRVRAIDDVTRGLSTADAGRVTAAYLTLVGTGDVELEFRGLRIGGGERL